MAWQVFPRRLHLWKNQTREGRTECPGQKVAPRLVGSRSRGGLGDRCWREWP